MNDICRALKHVGYSNEQISRIKGLGLSGQDEMSYSEFIARCMDQAEYLTKGNLKRIFKEIDVNSTGMIGKA